MKQWKTTKDRELWKLTVGKITLPFYATQGTMDEDEEKIWCVLPATFTGKLFMQIRPVLDAMTFMRAEESRFIKEEMFLKYFTKCEGITPSFYVASGEFERETKVKSQEVGASVPDPEQVEAMPSAFTNWMAETVGTYSADEWKLIWVTLCQQIPRYMLTSNDPIQFGWGTMFALPLRKNWQSIMLAKFPRIWTWLRHSYDWHKLEIAPFATEAKRADLLEIVTFRKRALVGWNIFFHTNKKWHGYITSVEDSLYTQLGPRAYLARVGDLLHRYWGGFIMLLRGYVEGSRIPCGDVAAPEHPADAHLVAYKPEGKVHPVHHANIPTRVVCDYSDDGVVPAGRSGSPKAEANYVQEVPYVSVWATEKPDDWDMRQGRRSDA